MQPKIIPLRDQVLIEREKIEIFGSIHTPTSADTYRFFVRAVGPDVTDVEVGDEVDINPQLVAASGAIQPAQMGSDFALHKVDAVVCKVERSALSAVSAR